MKKVSGKERILHVFKKRGLTFLKKEEACNDEKYVERVDGQTEKFELVNSRTIALSQFEFAKIGMGIIAEFKTPVSDRSKEVFFKAARRAVDEILNRETAQLRNEKRPDRPIVFNAGVNRSVWMKYGLTLKGDARFESNKFEVAATRVIDEDKNMGKVIEELQDYLTDKIGEERERIYGEGKEKTGL